MKGIFYITFIVLLNFSNALVHIPCDFQNTPRGYECRLPDVDLSQFDDFAIIGGPHLPGQNDATVVSFMSVNNNFYSFPTTHIARFPGLRHIKVSGSLIPSLSAGAVANRPLLETLSLSNNLITEIDPQAFTGTPNIQELNLMFNQIRILLPTVFNVFPQLRILNIGFNLIERVPPTFLVNNPLITSLDMNANRITFMNQTFFNNIMALTTLQFNANLCYSGAFFQVNIPTNRNDMLNRLLPCFIERPVEFRCLFGTEFNGVEFDGAYTCLLRQIEAFDMEKTIELSGFHLAGRTNLDVTFLWMDASNVRFFLNEMFWEFINLRGVMISGSGLQLIQEGAFRNANQLRHLAIIVNQVQRLEANTFQFASTLEEIILWHNQLNYIHEQAFAGLTNLRELHLLGGQLSYIPPNTFVPLQSLQFIDVGYNLVDVLDRRWFANNTLVNRISFNSNIIYAVHQSIVDLPNLTNLLLYDNVCIDRSFHITPQNREQVREELNPCIANYPLRRQRFILDLEGDLTILDSNGTVIGVL